MCLCVKRILTQSVSNNVNLSVPSAPYLEEEGQNILMTEMPFPPRQGSLKPLVYRAPGLVMLRYHKKGEIVAEYILICYLI